MAELSRFYGIVIAIYFRGEVGRHNTPHVHVSYSGESAQVGLDGEILAGWLPRTAHRLVRQWLREHGDEVAAAWQSARQGRRVRRIEPLQ
jgi:hypothetical protein